MLSSSISEDGFKAIDLEREKHRLYDYQLSSSAELIGQEFFAPYDEGEIWAKGRIVKDVVRVGSLDIPALKFGVAQIISSGVFEDDYDGIIGLAFSQYQHGTYQPSKFEAALAYLQEPIFWFDLR